MFERAPRSTILVHTTTRYVRVAVLERSDASGQSISEAAEFAIDDQAGLQAWIEAQASEGPGWVAGFCGFQPSGSMLIREDLVVREPPLKLEAIAPLVDRRARNHPKEGWSIGVVNAVNGSSLSQATGPCTALIVAMPRDEVLLHQEKLLEIGVRPRRMEFTPLTSLGAIKSHFTTELTDTAMAVCDFGERETSLYFIDRKGVHPQDPLPFGLNTLEESAQKDLNLETIEEVRSQMDAPDEEFSRRAPRLLRIYASHLRLTLDYYEHQTGRIVGSLFPLNLPSNRNWLAPALAQAVDLVVPHLDLLDWAQQNGLDFDPLPNDGDGWLPTLALAAKLNSETNDGSAS
jgi:hypothetical protein